MIRIFMLLSLLGLSVCETVKGVGHDITRAAETVDRL